MTISRARAKKLANHILREHRKGRSYRVIAREDFPLRSDGNPVVKAGTLNRFAKSKGEWMPKDCELLRALGLVKERSPFAVLPRWYKRTQAALEYYQRKKDQIKKLSKETREAVKP